MQGKYSYPESANISSNGKDIIDKFLRNDPKERITLE
jgi:hypothetical protein